MSIPMYLAMTAGEFSKAYPLPPRTAWMAMHFSVSGPGLSNRPTALPPGSLLILDDQIPWNGHSLEAVCQETVDTLLLTGAAGLLLDFERSPTEETRCLASLLTQCCREAHYPIGMPPAFLGQEHAAVFLPPLPCWQSPGEALAPYAGLEIWLEAAPCGCRVSLQTDGVTMQPEEAGILAETAKKHISFLDSKLHCHYFATPAPEGLQLSLYDTAESLEEKLEACRPYGVTLAIAIWRQVQTGQSKLKLPS